MILKKMNLRSRTVILLICCFCRIDATSLYAQTNPILSAAVSPKEVVAGTSFEITFKLDGDNQAILNPPAFGVFKPTGGVQKMNGATIINGKASTYSTWTYTLMAPAKAGVYTIPHTYARTGLHTADERLVTCASFTVKVIEPQSITPTPGKVVIPHGVDENLFVTTIANAKTVVPGQQVIVQVRIYTRINIDNFDIIELPVIENGYAQELKRYDNQTKFVKIKGVDYATRSLYSAAVFPQKEGELIIKPAKVRVGVETSGTYGFEQRVINTPITIIKVKPLPTPVPADFTGVVGSYDISAAVDRDTITTADAVTLRIEVRGNGDSKRFHLPTLALNEPLETFAPKEVTTEEYENGEAMMHSGKYDYVIQAKQSGTTALAPTLSWYDPDSNKYVQWKSPVLPLTVLEKPAAAAPVETNPPAMSVTWWPLSSTTIGISALILAAVIALLYFWWHQKRSKPAPVVVIEKKPKAVPDKAPVTAVPPTAPAFTEISIPTYSLRRMLDDGAPPRTFYEGAYNTLKVYFQQAGLNSNELSHDNISRQLQSKGLSETRIEALLRAWDHCETAIFTGQSKPDWMESILDDLNGHKKSA